VLVEERAGDLCSVTDTAGELRVIENVDDGAGGVGEAKPGIAMPLSPKAPVQGVAAGVSKQIIVIEEADVRGADSLGRLQHSGAEHLVGQRPVTS
jgi:hypothetical protein